MSRTLLLVYLALFAPLLRAASDAPARPRAEIYADLSQRHTAAAAALQTARDGVERIEARLARFDLSDENLARLISEATAERDHLQLSTAELEQLVQRLEKLLQLDLDSVAAALTRALAERERLQDQVATAETELAQVTEDSELQRAVSLDGLTARPFLLTGDRIAPFSEPYFEAEMIKVRLADRRVVERPRYTRESDAGTIADAVEPGGVLHQLVTSPDFDRATTYVALWVCDDAIAGYRTVVDFLKAHRIRYTWIPDVDSPWTALEDDAPLGTWGYGG